MKNENKTVKKIKSGMLLIVLLSLGFAVTTFALVYATVSLENNPFSTGIISIDLNGGNQIISEDELKFEPGMTVNKEFYIQNNSTWDVYYKIYFDKLAGGLENVLEITIFDGDKILYHGTAEQLERSKVKAADESLVIGQRRVLGISFHYPDNAQNVSQDASLSFDLCAEAVQTKNNPDKKFK